MNLKSVVETILFVRGEPLSLKKLAAAARAETEKVKDALRELREEYKDRGFALLEKDGDWQLGSHPQNSEYIENLVREELNEELSRAALETLAIIAYKGPISRAELEYLRGVNSSFILRNLLLRGLAERVENPKDARSFLYRVSMDFLKHLGLESIADLPQFAEFKKAESGTESETSAEMTLRAQAHDVSALQSKHAGLSAERNPAQKTTALHGQDKWSSGAVIKNGAKSEN